MSRIRKFVNTILVPENFREGGAYDTEFKKRRSGGSFKDTFGVDSLPELINDYGGTGVGEEFNTTSTGKRLFGTTIHHGKETEEKVFWNVRQNAGPSSLQAALKTTKMPYMRKRMYRRRLKRRLTRRYRRRRGRFGLRVRRQAIKLNEPKFHKVFFNQNMKNVFGFDNIEDDPGTKTTAVNSNGMSIELCKIDHQDTGGSSTTAETNYIEKKTKRVGDTIFVRGIKLLINVNGSGAGPGEKNFRFVVYSPKDWRSQDIAITPGKIFRSTALSTPEKNEKIFTNYAEGETPDIEAAYSRVHRGQVRVWSEFRTKILGQDSIETASDSRHLKVWVPINKYMKFEGSASTATTSNMPVFLYCHWHNDALSNSNTNVVQVEGMAKT
ncbi:hypothetical protein ACQZV8_19975, partial [Magnetococcales bacterium HHB-1]